AVALLAFAGALTLLLIPPFGARILRAMGLDPSSPVHRVVAVAFVLTVIDAIALFTELAESAPAQMPFYPSDPLLSLVTDVSLASPCRPSSGRSPRVWRGAACGEGSWCSPSWSRWASSS